MNKFSTFCAVYFFAFSVLAAVVYFFAFQAEFATIRGLMFFDAAGLFILGSCILSASIPEKDF